MINQNIVLEYGVVEGFDDYQHIADLSVSGSPELLKALAMLDGLDEFTLKVINTYLELILSKEKA